MNNKPAQKPKVSIIIPLYKCERFVDELLDMICGQTLEEIELICVLDGPDDGIKRKVETRAKEDYRITCLVQEHAGAGPARNAGLEIARGEYLLFLDADDLFKPNMAERLYTEAVKYDADIVICSHVHQNMRTKVNTSGLGMAYSTFPENTVIDCAKVKGLYAAFWGAAWNKLFKREFIETLGLRYMDTRISNDEFFVTAAMTSAKRLVAVKDELLTIRRFVNPDSITSSRSKCNEDIVKVMDQIYRWLKEKGYWKTREEDYYFKVAEFLKYNSEFDYNEKFVEEMARALSTEKPWKNLSNAKLMHVLNMRIADIETIRNNTADEINALRPSVDVSGREEILRMNENRLSNIKRIRKLMKTKYGRDLGKRDNPIAWLKWSVGYRGWKGTFRKLKEKMDGEKVINLSNVICTGHITTARHYLVLFIPMETYREKVSIEDLSIAVRCNGYYPMAVSGENGAVITPLGPAITPIINGGIPTRHNEIIRVYGEVSPGLGIFVQVRFKEDLLKNRKGDKVDNNYPVSVHLVEGKIILK